MNEREIALGIKTLEKAYNRAYSKGQVEIWINKFSGWDKETFNDSINECIETCNFLPTIADMYKMKNKPLMVG